MANVLSSKDVYATKKRNRRCAAQQQNQMSKETAGDGRLSAPQKVSATPLIFTTLLGI